MSVAINIQVTLSEINCGECGGTYAINERYREQKSDNGGYWNCPYCQCSWGYGESQIDRIKKEKERVARRLELEKNRRESAERSLTAQKGVNTKLKKRIGAGTCPCCHRTFKQLTAHMKNKHPTYDQ